MMKFHRDTKALKLDVFNGADMDVIDAVCKEIIAGWQMKIQLARAAQARKKAEMDRLAGYALEGIGQHTLSVDRESFMYWGTREGFECWDDDEFLREYARDNETARVKTLRRAQVAVPDWRASLDRAARAKGSRPRILAVKEDFSPAGNDEAGMPKPDPDAFIAATASLFSPE